MIDRACISLGEHCNLHCKYCHFESRLSHLNQEFDSIEMIAIIDHIRSYISKNSLSSFKIGIVGAGEPMLQFYVIKDLVEYLKSINETRLHLYTITNGLLVTNSVLKFFHEHQDLIALNYSYDGYKEVHDYGREQHDKVLQRINEYEIEFGRKPSINCTIHHMSLMNSEKLLTYFEQLQFPVITFSRIVDSKDPALAISSVEFDAFLQQSKKYNVCVRQHLVGNEHKVDCTMYGNICGVGRTNPFITKLGVYPSGRFYGNPNYRLGSPFDTITDIEFAMKGIQPVERGQCFFDTHNIGGAK